MSLRGADQLRARLHALETARKPINTSLADKFIEEARHRIRVRTGHTRSTLRLGKVDEKGAKLIGDKVAVILDRGARSHDIEPKQRSVLVFNGRNGAVFAKQVHKPRQQGTHYLRRSMQETAKSPHLTDPIVTAWNGAA